jgi:hypothetical protein
MRSIGSKTSDPRRKAQQTRATWLFSANVADARLYVNGTLAAANAACVGFDLPAIYTNQPAQRPVIPQYSFRHPTVASAVIRPG